MTAHDFTSDPFLRQLARWLAPYLREELGIQANPPAYSDAYDVETCRRFVTREHLSEGVLRRARIFFVRLRSGDTVSAPEVVELLGLKGSRSIAAALTNPLKKRRNKFGFERMPWDEGWDGSNTTWTDRDGIASRMVAAIDAELGEV
jgi:hypothetical protein